MLRYSLSVWVLLVSACPRTGGVELEEEIGVIKELLQSQHSLEARHRAELLLRDHPANPALQYLVAYSEAQQEEGDKVEAVRLALEVINQPEIASNLYGTAAQLALEAAHNSDNDSLITEASHQVIVRDSQRPLRDKATRELALTLLGEQFLLKGEVLRAEETVMSLDPGDHQDVSLALLQLLVVRLRERRLGQTGGESEEILLGIEPGDQQQMEDAKEMLKRIEDRWDKNRTSLATEYDEMLELLVMLGVHVSKYQRPGWYEAELEAKPVWRLEELGEAGHILLDIQARWETLRTEAERLMSGHHWSGGEAGLWTRGEKELETAGRWQQLVVAGFGFPAPPSSLCHSAPVLCSLSAQLYQAGSCPAGQIKLSVMSGATEVRPHCGLANTKLRAHLPLLVPSDPPPWLRVAEHHLTWQEGEMIVFDDSFEHEVRHESNKTRIVLILDINHPDLSEEKRAWYENHLEVEGYDVDGPRFKLNKEKIIDENSNKKEEL